MRRPEEDAAQMLSRSPVRRPDNWVARVNRAQAAKDEALIARIKELSESDLREAFRLKQKKARSEAIDAIWKRVFEAVGVGSEGGPTSQSVGTIPRTNGSGFVHSKLAPFGFTASDQITLLPGFDVKSHAKK